MYVPMASAADTKSNGFLHTKERSRINPAKLFLLLLPVGFGIRNYIPQHFAHKRLFLAQVVRQLVGMQKESKLAHGLFEFGLVRAIAICVSLRNLLWCYWIPLGKVLVAGDTKLGRKDILNRYE